MVKTKQLYVSAGMVGEDSANQGCWADCCHLASHSDDPPCANYDCAWICVVVGVHSIQPGDSCLLPRQMGGG